MRRQSVRDWFQVGVAVLLAWWGIGPAWGAGRTVVVSELMYAPLPDPAGVESTSDYEFIELQNVSAAAVNLGGAYLTNAVTFVFPAGTTIPAGGFLVVPAKRSVFQARYGTAATLTGGFSGNLSASGETLELRAANGSVWLSLTYDSSGAWPSRADGLGSSLELIDPQGDLDDPANWRSSTEYQGSPGKAGVGPLKQVVINELLAHTDPPFEDAIELYNVTDAAVAIGGWYVSNKRSNPLKFRIPAGTTIPARSFKVFYELARTGSDTGFNPDGTGDNPSFTFNSANGDEACLLTVDASGQPLYWMDAVSFGPTDNGKSLGRYPDGAGKLTPLSRPTFGTQVDMSFPEEFIAVFRTGGGASNAYPEVGPVVISRVMYHPPDGDDEFIELQNVAATATPLFDPAYPTNTWRLRNAVDFDLPAGVTLAAGEKLLVVPTAPEVFRARYALPATLKIYGPWTNALNNAGENIELLYPDTPQLPPHPDAGLVPYVLLEEVSYLSTAPWPTAADGWGPALRRKDTKLWANDPASWEAEATVITPPSVSAVMAGTQLSLSFVAEAGRTYRLQRRAAVATGSWDAGTSVTTPAAGGAATVTLTAAGSAEFFRITVE